MYIFVCIYMCVCIFIFFIQLRERESMWRGGAEGKRDSSRLHAEHGAQ